MEIQLTPETEKKINTAVASGSYITTDEYIKDALHNYYDLKRKFLNDALALGIEQAGRKEFSKRSGHYQRQRNSKIQLIHETIFSYPRSRC